MGGRFTAKTLRVRMNMKRLFVGCGGMMLVLAVLLPPARVLALAVPADAAAFSDDLLAGLWCFKVALAIAGIVLAAFPFLVSWLWRERSPLDARPTSFLAGIEPSPVFERWEKIGLSVIVLLAMVLRLVAAGQGFSGDEILVQRSFVDRGLPVILTYWPACTHHIGYEILAWFCERLPFSIEFSARLPAVMFGTLAVWAGYRLARIALTGTVSMTFTLLHAVSLFAIMHANMLKGYSAVLFLCVTAMIGILGVVSRPLQTRYWVMMGLSMAVMPYMHLHSVYLVVGLALAFLLLWLAAARSNVQLHLLFLRRSILTFGLMGIGLFLVYSITLPQIIRTAQGMGDRAELPLSFDFFRGWLTQMTFWTGKQYASLVALVAAAVGFVRLVRRNASLALLLLLPVTVVLLVTWVSGGFIYPRYMVFAVPTFFVLFVLGFDAVGSCVSSRAFRVALLGGAAIGFFVLQFPAMADYYRFGNQNLRGAIERAQTEAGAGDGIVAYGLARNLFPLFDEQIRPIADLDELGAELAGASGDTYLLYAWRKSWRAREGDFVWIHENFDVVHRFEGMLMDTTTPDGDVVLMVRAGSRDVNRR